MHIDPNDVMQLVADSGGELVGKTRLQKSVYILERAGLGSGFTFAYHHYGPYSEELSISADYAVALNLIEEERKEASWGGEYFVYKSKSSAVPCENDDRNKILKKLSAVDSVQLELAATAFLLHDLGYDPPWDELVERKTDKATKTNIAAAKKLCKDLADLEVPTPLPKL
jgi:uncharacterized protein